MIYIHIIRVHY